MINRHDPTIPTGTGTLALIDDLTLAISNEHGDTGDGREGVGGVPGSIGHLGHGSRGCVLPRKQLPRIAR